MINAFIIIATFVIAFFAFIWEGKGLLNIVIKLTCAAVAVIGAICSAAVLGVTP